MHKVFVADKLAQEGLDALAEYPELDVEFAPGLSVEDAIPKAQQADAIIVRSATKIRGELLDAARQLRVVGRAGIGVDNIDLDITTERGIVVLNTPDANATTTAELAVAHMFSLSRSLPAADQSVRDGKWERNKFVGAELSGKRVGIIGFGTIGRLVAERCLGLKMQVFGHDPFVTEQTFAEHGVELLELDEMIASVDYLTLHCPMTEGTKNILNRERLSSMKPGARIINCARGGLIEESALAELVEAGKIAGAALDVFAEEPPGESPLFGVQNIQFTPHLGASTEEAQTAVGVEIAHQIAAFLLRGEIINSVNAASVAPEKLTQLQPYMDLAKKLGRLACRMGESAYTEVEIGIFGDAAELDGHPIASAALVGLLCEHHSVPVNQVNAKHLARRQGMRVTEVSSEESRDYVSLIRVTATSADGDLCIEGAIFDERHPRLLRINEYAVESALEGHVLFTRHADQPGVVGKLGAILGDEGINIANMQVGASPNGDTAVALVGISQPLNDSALAAVLEIEAVDKVLQVEF
ncbi:MAG: phosphoglycerate dehydrogenase [Pseudomonadota bacterium]